MNTVTAKEFRKRQSSILKEVASGKTYAITFHKKPMVTLTPAQPVKPTRPVPGSYEAFLDSLKYTTHVTGDMHTLSYKELRAKKMDDKYGA